MFTLIIDTSTEKSLIAFTQGDQLLLNYFLSGAQSSRYLMATVETGFKQLNLSPQNLEAVAVSVGPGSYTGTRVGVAVAKGLSFPRSLPLIGFYSLEGFISEKEGIFASLIDAKLGGGYVLLQQRKGKVVSLLSSPQLISKDKLDFHLKGCNEIVGPHNTSPAPQHIASLVAQKIVRKEYRADLDILYLRTPDYFARRK